MAWKEVGGNAGAGGNSSPVLKWNSVGQTVEGIYRGQREGKYGPLLVIQTPNGEVVYGVKAVLKRKLQGIEPGDRIKIEYLGKRKGQSGVEYGDFQVFVDTAGSSHKQAVNVVNDPAEFQRLVNLIRADKNHTIAEALAVAAKATGDPVQSLRYAMYQIGTPQF
jgi:hypothetical protein